MPNAARLFDLCTGHQCFPPRPNCQASGNVFINGRGAHRAKGEYYSSNGTKVIVDGDAWFPHCCDPPSCHGGKTISGSGTVSVNGQPAARIEDQVSCGSRIMTGSGNVFIGD